MNEYLEELHELTCRAPDGTWRRMPMGGGARSNIRKDVFVQKYGWAIPSDEAIEKLTELSPILEVGAGKGYWSYLIEENSGTVMATDKEPPQLREQWTDVIEADATIAGNPELHDHTLFMCWPSYGKSWAGDAVELYGGDTVVYVGEGRGGCTGDQYLHRKLDEKFGIAEEVIDIPQWSGIRDRMYVFKR